MTMGPYGVHWERTQTWWNMVPAYHSYLSRCQFMLRQGLPVADVCFLVAEGAPQVFLPPTSALRDSSPSTGRPDRLGYNFDGIAPEVLVARMSVEDGRLILPNGMSYRVLALPERETMTPALLRKIKSLVGAGATVIGPPPRKSPSLSGYPECDREVQELARRMWGEIDGQEITEHKFGHGRVIWYRPPVTQLNTNAGEKRLLERASWIWDEQNRELSGHGTIHAFHRDFSILKSQHVESASVHVTADHPFTLWVNDNVAGKSEDPAAIYAFEVGYLLRTGRNRVALQVEDDRTTPDTAGVLGSVVVKFHDAQTLEFPTNGDWAAVSNPTTGWKAARAIGPYDASPWKSRMRTAALPEQYGDFGGVAKVLSDMNVSPDFESDAPLR